MGNEDIINCISEHDVDMRHNKMEDREASQKEVKDGHDVDEIGAGGWGGVHQYALERKSKE